MLRIEDTEEDVDLRPRRPLLGRRKADRGVRGEGESDVRLLGVVFNRCGCGRVELVFTCGRAVAIFDVTSLGLGSFGPARELFSDFVRRFGVEVLFLVLGDLARFADSNNQCFQCARWLKKAR